jgi:hypothetical protein
MTVTITHHAESSRTTIREGSGRLVYDGPEPDGLAGAERTARFSHLIGFDVVLVVEP